MANCERFRRRRTTETSHTVDIDESSQECDIDADLIASGERCEEMSGAAGVSSDSSSAASPASPMLAHADGLSKPQSLRSLLNAPSRTADGIEGVTPRGVETSSPSTFARDGDCLAAPADAGTVAVDSIGVINRITDDATGIFMLSPIAATKEVQMNRDRGKTSMGWTVSDNQQYTESNRATFVADTSMPTRGTKNDDKNGSAYYEKSLVEGAELFEEYVDQCNLDETELRSDGGGPNDAVHQAHPSPVAETGCVEHEDSSAPDSPSNVSKNSRTEYDIHIDQQNESFVTNSKRDEMIARTQEELGATSIAFLYRLRGAAFRRKKRLVNSRNDMLAMERSHREDIEAARRQIHHPLSVDPPVLQQTSEQQTSNEFVSGANSAPEPQLLGAVRVPKVVQRPVKIALSPLLGARRHLKPSEYTPSTTDAAGGAGFAARPLPKTTGEKGHGGQSGLPKVEKRPVTRPVSPLLGSRRQPDDYSQSSGLPAAARRSENVKSGFKALPLPKSLSANGVSGVPRIPSKPPTVPWSPLLGFRRKPVQKPVGHAQQSNKSPRCASTPSSLVGLNLLHTSTDENLFPQNPTPAAPLSIPGYEPHSTVRAKQRAEYDAYLAEREKERLAEESRARLAQAKILRAELRELQKSL